ncbi:hypothetical protein SAMN05518682_1981 [Cellulosimicrobium aquatile]|uniref:Uncharacterized protein n=1 Tax=Cellulosimicrobium aquatile TaxID=1612203 RepID=A0A1N6RKB5_9MICO|nr:Uncharacterised protein [Mycobacteroides abscessus]SIQ29249.1 hypothetical protein SAMN05518682_1981 [Cellulosimicrobium aquatile]
MASRGHRGEHGPTAVRHQARHQVRHQGIDA